MSAFAKGEPSKKVRSLNVAISHMGTLDSMIPALQNGNVQAQNQFEQFFKKEFGQSPGTNFNAAAGMVGKEVVNAVIAGGGGQGERDEVTDVFSKINSPTQLHDAIKTYLPLLGGQMEGLHRQYISGTNGRTDFAKYLEPKTKEVLGFNEQSSAPPPQPPAGTPLTNDKGWQLHHDAKGRWGYVSPDRKQYESVK